jgi:hypothetical protein
MSPLSRIEFGSRFLSLRDDHFPRFRRRRLTLTMFVYIHTSTSSSAHQNQPNRQCVGFRPLRSGHWALCSVGLLSQSLIPHGPDVHHGSNEVVDYKTHGMSCTCLRPRVQIARTYFNLINECHRIDSIVDYCVYTVRLIYVRCTYLVWGIITNNVPSSRLLQNTNFNCFDLSSFTGYSEQSEIQRGPLPSLAATP